MKSTEKMETRLERVTMHDFFLQRIEKAIATDCYSKLYRGFLACVCLS